MAYKFQLGAAKLGGNLTTLDITTDADGVISGSIGRFTHLSCSSNSIVIGSTTLSESELGILDGIADHDVTVGSDSIVIFDSGTNKLRHDLLSDYATAIAGDGLAASSGVLAVGVDDTGIEINSDALRLKDSGVATAKIADNAVTLAKMAGITRGSIILGDASGDPSLLAKGTAAQFLQSDGTDPSYVSISGDATVAAGGALTIANDAVEQAMIADDAVGADQLAANAVVNASVASGAAIDFSKINTNVDMGGNYTIGNQSDDVATFAGGLTVTGDLTVNGTTTTINSTTIELDDKNIELAKGLGDDAAVNGAGITIDSTEGDKTFQYVAANESLQSNQHLDVASGKGYLVAGTSVLDANGAVKVQSGVAGAGLGHSSGVLAVQVSGALSLPSDHLFLSSSVAGTGLGVAPGDVASGIVTSLEIDIVSLTELAHADIADADDMIIHDAGGGTKKVGVDSLRDHFFGVVSGDATVADGGALTIAANAVEGSMINSNAAGTGLEYSSNAINLDLNSLSTVAITTSDVIPYIDSSDSNNPKKATFTQLSNALAGGGLAQSGGALVLNIDGLTDISAAPHATQDMFAVSDNGTEKKVSMTNVANGAFALVSGDATIATGGALTIGTGVVEHAMLAADCIDGDNIQDDVVNSEHIALGALDAEHYSSGSVENGHLANSAVTIGSTAVSLGASSTVFAGITQLTASNIRVDNLDVITINSVTQTENTLEIADKTIVAALSASSANADGGGLRIGGGASDLGHASIMWDHSNTALQFVIGNETQMLLLNGALRPETDDDLDLGSSTHKFKDLYIDGTANVDALSLNGVAITATGAELNYLDNSDLEAADLQKLADLTATAAEINLLDAGVTTTALQVADSDNFIIFDDSDSDVAKKVKMSNIKEYVQKKGILEYDAGSLANASNTNLTLADANKVVRASSAMGSDKNININLPAIDGNNLGEVFMIKAPSDCGADRTVTIKPQSGDKIDGTTNQTVLLESSFAAVTIVVVADDEFAIF